MKTTPAILLVFIHSLSQTYWIIRFHSMLLTWALTFQLCQFCLTQIAKSTGGPCGRGGAPGFCDVRQAECAELEIRYTCPKQAREFGDILQQLRTCLTHIAAYRSDSGCSRGRFPGGARLRCASLFTTTGWQTTL